MLRLSRRLLTTSSLPEHRALVVKSFGEPRTVVELKITKPEEILPKTLGPNEILVDHLAACINPADLTTARGRYGRVPELPAILGNEGVTKVLSVGSNVKHLKPGDTTIGLGVYCHWQSYSVQNADSFYKIDANLDTSVAAQLKVNPCTAYRMLKDFQNLKPGDVVIQNGANSAVGLYVIQLAKLWGYKTINVIRDRPEKDQVVGQLREFGADHVVTEAEVSSRDFITPLLKDLGRPKLFLDCVGGKNAMNCHRTLEIGASIVTYGAMSNQASTISPGSFIFKDWNARGFWMTRWFDERGSQRRQEVHDLLNEVANLHQNGTLRAKATRVIDFEDRNVAFDSKSSDVKFVFGINKQ